MQFTLTALFALAATTLASAASVPGNSGLEFCDGTSADAWPLRMEFVSLEPNPPVKGQPVTVTANGTSTIAIQDGSSVEMRFSKSIFHKTYTHPICSEMACPSRQLAVQVSEQVSHDGEFKAQIKIKGTEGGVLSCMEGEVEILDD